MLKTIKFKVFAYIVSFTNAKEQNIYSLIDNLR